MNSTGKQRKVGSITIPLPNVAGFENAEMSEEEQLRILTGGRWPNTVACEEKDERKDTVTHRENEMRRRDELPATDASLSRFQPSSMLAASSAPTSSNITQPCPSPPDSWDNKLVATSSSGRVTSPTGSMNFRKLSAELRTLTLEVSQLQQTLEREKIERLKLVDEYQKRDEDMVGRLNRISEQLRQALIQQTVGVPPTQTNGANSENAAGGGAGWISGSSSDEGDTRERQAEYRPKRRSAKTRRSKSSEARRSSSLAQQHHGQYEGHRRPSRTDLPPNNLSRHNSGNSNRGGRYGYGPSVVRSRSTEFDWHANGPHEHPTPFAARPRPPPTQGYHSALEDEDDSDYYYPHEVDHPLMPREHPHDIYRRASSGRRYTMEEPRWGPWPPGPMMAPPPPPPVPPSHGLGSQSDARRPSFIHQYHPGGTNRYPPPSSRFHSMPPEGHPQMGYL